MILIAFVQSLSQHPRDREGFPFLEASYRSVCPCLSSWIHQFVLFLWVFVNLLRFFGSLWTYSLLKILLFFVPRMLMQIGSTTSFSGPIGPELVYPWYILRLSDYICIQVEFTCWIREENYISAAVTRSSSSPNEIWLHVGLHSPSGAVFGRLWRLLCKQCACDTID